MLGQSTPLSSFGLMSYEMCTGTYDIGVSRGGIVCRPGTSGLFVDGSLDIYRHAHPWVNAALPIGRASRKLV